jgi:excisionase family DNA binding protein
MSMPVDLNELAALPSLVRALQARVAELERSREPVEPEPLIDVDAAAELLGMTPVAVRAAARRGTLPAVHVGRRVRFRRSELRR